MFADCLMWEGGCGGRKSQSVMLTRVATSAGGGGGGTWLPSGRAGAPGRRLQCLCAEAHVAQKQVVASQLAWRGDSRAAAAVAAAWASDDDRWASAAAAEEGYKGSPAGAAAPYYQAVRSSGTPEAQQQGGADKEVLYQEEANEEALQGGSCWPSSSAAGIRSRLRRLQQ